VATEEIVRILREEGHSLIESMSALIKAGGLTFDDARAAVIESPTWADHRDKIATNQWVDPPERPDEPALERLREVCRVEPRIAEVWVTGSRFRRSDGSTDLSTGIAVVLDPPLPDVRNATENAWQMEIAAKLEDAWPTSGRRSWIWGTRGTVEARREHCLPVYSRAEP
jgi:hypothetical protein